MKDALRRPPFLAALLLASASIGCAAESDDRPGAWDGSGSQEAPLTSDERAPLGCVENAQHDCVIYVNQANGVLSCWKGVQFCVDGAWTECMVDENSGSTPE